jgi:hypothetical protein
LLLLDVLSDDGEWSAPTTARKIARRPKAVSPRLAANGMIVIFAKEAAGNTFQAVNQGRNGNLGWIRNEKMYVIILAVKFDC